MAMYADDNDSQASNVAYGLDQVSSTNDQGSIFDSIGNVVTKGVPLTALAAVNSFANTGIEVANLFGAGLDKVSVHDEVGDGDLSDYYDKHQEGIETAGLIAGSLIPGLAAVKALKLAQLGEFGNSLKAATGIFSGPKQAIIDGATNEITSEGGGLFNLLNSDKVKAVALGAGDQFIQGLAYSAASAATQHASPLLDQQGVSDTLDNVLWGGITGGLFGGFIEGIGTVANFNKILNTADFATKPQEIAGYLGLGGYTGGDRAAVLLKSIDDIPAPTNVLGAQKLGITTDNAINTAKATIATLVPNGDKDVSSAFFDGVMQTKAAGASSDDVYNYFSRLASVSRIDDPTQVATQDHFYINRQITSNVQEAGWNDIASSTPDPKQSFALAYTAKPFAAPPIIAKATDTFLDINGGASPAFETAGQAWKLGADVFIDAKGTTYVNPDSVNLKQVARPGESRPLTQTEDISYRGPTGSLPEGSKPLYGAPLVFNVKSGALTTSEGTVPVIGDFGKPQLFTGGVIAGDKTFLQDMSTTLTSSTPTADANARYVWASMRGIKPGDTIEAGDLPLIEQLYKEATTSKQGFSEYMEMRDRQGVSLGEDEQPLSAYTPETLLSHIQGEKDNLITELLDGSPGNQKLSSDDIALRANVSPDYIQNGLQGDVSTFMADTSSYSDINHVKLQYDISSQNIVDGQVLKGMIDTQYRVGLIKQAAQDWAGKAFVKMSDGEDPDFSKYIITKTASDAGIVDRTGNKFLTSSNADYNTLGQQTERVGNLVSRLSQKMMSTVSSVLSSSVQAIRNDPVAAAELGIFRAVRQRTAENFTFIPPEIAQAENISPNTAILTSSLLKDKDGNITGWNKDLVPDGFIHGSEDAATKFDENGEATLKSYYTLSDKTAAFERAQQQLNDDRVTLRNGWYTAQGLNKSLPVGNLYTPPVNTARYPYFAYVKFRPGMGGADDSTSVITAASAEELQSKISNLDPRLSAFTKDQGKDYFAAEGDYQFSRNFSSTATNATLARNGVLNNIFPDTRAETIIKDYVDWNQKQTLSLIRDHVELANGQLFAELRGMGDRFADTASSRAGFVAGFLKKSADNPYDTYIKTALGIGGGENYPLWQYANEKLESTFSTAFNTAKSAFGAATRGLLPYDKAADMAKDFGLGTPYSQGINALKTYNDVANKLPTGRVLSHFQGVANSILGATVITLDTFQQMIHILATPVMLTAETMSATKQLGDLLTTQLPDGSGRAVPSTMKIIYNAVKNFWNPDVQNQWGDIYAQSGANRDLISAYRDTINNLALPQSGILSESGLQDKLDSALATAQKLTGASFSRSFIHFVAADTGRQLFEAGGFAGNDLTDMIRTFTNRVQGNYIASQRPIAFQGPLGQAVGLFQTYQQNLYQQLFRYIGNGEAKTVATAAAIQSTLFGFQSLPGFQYLNNHLVGMAAGNNTHQDLYTALNSFTDKPLDDFLMYGAVSSFLPGSPALYSRGDLNPRNITILPVNPLNFPAVSGAVRFLGSMYDASQKIANGGSVPTSLLIGLEHNGLSRPLMGLAQLMQGFTTTSDGSIISATRPGIDNAPGNSDFYSMANFSRLLGARPLDEAITLEGMFRSNMYQAKNLTQIEHVGAAVKTDLYDGNEPTSEAVNNFMSNYASAGGNMNTFGQHMLKWNQDANSSIANKFFKATRNPAAQTYMRTMGGVPLPDFSTVGSTQTSDTQ